MAAPEVKGTEAKDKPVPPDHAKEIAPQIAALPAAEQRAAVQKEMQRVSETSGSGLPELTIANDKDKHLAVISKDGKPVEIVDEAGKTWKTDGKNLFSDGQDQRLLAPKMIDGKPAQNADGTPQYDLLQVKTRQEDNTDGTKRNVVTQITDGDGRKWASIDGQNFIGAAGANGNGQAGDQRILKDNNGSLEFTDPKGGALSEEAIKGKEQEIQNLIKQNSYLIPQSTYSEIPFSYNSGSPDEHVDGRNLNKVLENSSPDLLARFDKDLNLRASLKGKMDAADYENMTRILDGATDNTVARADRIFANGTGNSGVDAKPAEQEVQRLLLQTNAADMPKLNDALLNRINADPTQKKQYDQYVDQHKSDPGFDIKNAALLAFSKNFSKETQDAMPSLTKGNDQLDTGVGGVTPRQQMMKQALDNKDFDLFKTSITGAPAEVRAAIPHDAVDKAFSNLEWSSTANQRNLDIAHDLLDKGQIQPATEIKYSNVDQADKILAKLTPDQRASYNQGKDNTDPNNPDRQFYNGMQDAMKAATGGDAAKMLRLDDEARKQDGSYIATMTDHQHWYSNDWSAAVANKLDTMTADQRKDMADHYDERRKQMSDMVTALHDDPKVVLDKFDQMFKKTTPDADTSAAALLGNVHDVQSKSYAQPDDFGGTLAASAQAEAVAKTLQKGFTDDPELFNRLKNPQTDSEKQLAAILKDPDNLFGDSKSNFGSLATVGRLPLSEALRIGGHEFDQTAKDILGASSEDQKRFLSDPVEAKKELGSLANVDQKYELMKNILQQGKMQPEDEARAVTLGWNKQDDLKSLSGLDSNTGANYQKKYGEDLQVSLLNKYGHQDASVNDFLSKYNNVFQKTDDLFHESAVAGSGWASKLLDGTGSMTPQEMNVAANQMADMSAKLQKQLDNAPDSVKPEMQAFIDSQKRLKNAVDNHEDATKQLADTADKAISLAAMAVAVGVTGGAALPEAMAVVSAEAAANIAGGAILASGAGRLAMREELLGPNWKDKDREKESLDIAIDTAAQFGATKLLKVADVLKGMKAGAAMTAATRAQLESLGLSKRAVGVLEVSMEKAPSPASAVAGATEAAPTAAAAKTVTDEVAKHAALPKPAPTAADASADEVAKHAAAPQPTGVEATPVAGQPAVPGTNPPDASKALASNNPTDASKALATNNPTDASKALKAANPADIPTQAPLKLQSPSANDVTSGKITPEAFAKLSPGSKEFLFQMAQLGGIGAVDAKLKGESAVEGAAQWIAMGAAIHGAFAGLERSGIKFRFPQTGQKGEILGPGEMPVHAPENHESFEITTGNGTKIVNENGKYTVNGKPAEVKLNKVGDDYHVDYRMHDDPDGNWTRFDQKNPNGKIIEENDGHLVKTDIGELHSDSTGKELDKVRLNSDEGFEKIDGKWQPTKKNGDTWVATTDNANGDISNVEAIQHNGKFRVEVTYKHSVRTFEDNKWTQHSTDPVEPVKPSPAESAAPVEPVRPSAATEAVTPAPKGAVESIVPTPPPSPTAATDPFALPPASPIFDGRLLRPSTSPLNEFDPALLRNPSIFDPNEQTLVPSGRPEFEPKLVDPAKDLIPPVKEPQAPVRAEPIAPEPRLPAPPEDSTLPIVRDPVVSRPDEAAPEGNLRPLTPQQKATIASQLASHLPQNAVNDNTKPVEAPPVTPPDVPTPSPANAPLEPSATLAALATVKNWEGPFHSSDRVLQAVLGRRPTFEEIRSLTRAMQDQFKLDHNGQDIKAVGLKHGDQFLTAQNAESTIGLLAKSNPELAAQMQAYMRVDHDLGAKLGRLPAIDEVRAVSSQLQQNFMAQNHLQSLSQGDAQQFQNFAAANDDSATLQTLESSDERLQRIAQTYQQTGKLPPDGIISQRAFPSSAGQLHHHRRHAARR